MKLLNRQFNVLESKLNKLDKKIPDTHTLTNINQNNKNKDNLENKTEMMIKKYLALVAIAILQTKLKKLKTKHLPLVISQENKL